MFLLALLATIAWPAQASGAPDDCGSGVDAPGQPLAGLAIALPMDCDGALAGAGDTWDIYAVTFSEGPVYARLDHGANVDLDLCLFDATWTDGACPHDNDIAMWWPAGPAYVAVISARGQGSYHVSVRQQNDCGTGVDALWDDPPTVATPFIRCEAMLDTFVGDSEDAFLIPPPAVPDVALLRIEPYTWHVQLCVDDVVDDLAAQVLPHRRCTGSTYSRLLVARDPLRPLRVTVDGFNVQPFSYRLIVEDPVTNPPPIPPIL